MEQYHAAIHQNLLLLTKVFPNLDMDGKLQKGMFKKPNSKGMQSVFYSFMMILNPEYCKKNVPWPISFHTDNYKFRTAVIDFIKKECSDFEAPKLLPSLLNKAEGDKYVKFVFNFTTYVTKTVVSQKYEEPLMEKPSVNDVNCKENLDLLNNQIFVLLHEEDRNLNEYVKFKENWLKEANASESEFKELLETFQNKKQLLFGENENANVDDSAIEPLFENVEREIIQLKHHLGTKKAEMSRILKKQEYLVFLINLKKKTSTSQLAIKAVDNLAANKNNISKAIDIPVNVFLSNLIAKKTTLETTDYNISLKHFLDYGRLIIAAHMKRFLNLNFSPEHLAICHTVKDTYISSSKHVERLEMLNNQLSDAITSSEAEESTDSTINTANAPSKHSMEIANLVKLKRSYGSQSCVPIQMKNPISLFFNEKDEEESSKNPMERIKQKMQTTTSLSDSERTAKLYLK